MSKNNGKQNLEESYMNKYQKHVGCRYGYKLVCVDDKFCKPLRYILAEMKFTILSILWEKKVNFAVMQWKKHFNKVLMMTKEDNEDFKKIY